MNALTIASALEVAFPAADVAVSDIITIKVTPLSGHAITASFRIVGEKVVIRGWGGESSVKAGDAARCVKSVQRMIAASNKHYGLSA